MRSAILSVPPLAMRRSSFEFDLEARLPGEKQRTMLRELIIHITNILKLTSAFPTDWSYKHPYPSFQTARPQLKNMVTNPTCSVAPVQSPGHLSSVRLSLRCHCCHCRARYTPEIYRGKATHRKPLSMRPSIRPSLITSRMTERSRCYPNPPLQTIHPS
jgi:hypothetical protein